MHMPETLVAPHIRRLRLAELLGAARHGNIVAAGQNGPMPSLNFQNQ